MERIVVHVRDQHKAVMLFELLGALDFVEAVEVEPASATDSTNGVQGDDFFALAGLWAGRDVDLASIRAQAWPRRAQ